MGNVHPFQSHGDSELASLDALAMSYGLPVPYQSIIPNSAVNLLTQNEEKLYENNPTSSNTVEVFDPQHDTNSPINSHASQSQMVDELTGIASKTTHTKDLEASLRVEGVVTIGGRVPSIINILADRDWFNADLMGKNIYTHGSDSDTTASVKPALHDGLDATALAHQNPYSDRSHVDYTTTTSELHFSGIAALGNPTSIGTKSASNGIPVRSTPVDDYSASPTTVGSVLVGSSRNGIIGTASDRDWFRVTLIKGRSYEFTLTGMSLSDPNLLLRNSTGSLLASNDNSNDLNSRIVYTATATGSYFLDAGSPRALTGSYTIAVSEVASQTSSRIPSLTDTAINQHVNISLGDNLFSHQELARLFRTAAVNGIAEAELSDLKLIGSSLANYLPATTKTYSQYIYNAIVNGNTANQWWTGGQLSRTSLGNLKVGSPESVVNRLVDKWYSGLDLPSSTVDASTGESPTFQDYNYTSMTGSLFVNDVNFDDINQGQAGTCYFLASLATLARNQKSLIRNMFIDNGDGTYGVRFYGHGSKQNEIWVTVNKQIPSLQSQLVYAGNVTRSLTGEMWVALAEKAYGQANEIGLFSRVTSSNAYQSIEGGLDDAMSHISGLPIRGYAAYYSSPRWTSANDDATKWNAYKIQAINAFNAGRSLWLASFEETIGSNNKLNLISDHAYSIIGYDRATGMFKVSNPWGAGDSSYNGQFDVDWSTLFNAKAILSWV